MIQNFSLVLEDNRMRSETEIKSIIPPAGNSGRVVLPEPSCPLTRNFIESWVIVIPACGWSWLLKTVTIGSMWNLGAQVPFVPFGNILVPFAKYS